MTKKYTKTSIILVFLAFSLLPPAFADLPGFENSGVKTMRVLIQVNTVIQNGTGATEVKNDWRMDYVDIAGEKILEQTIRGDEHLQGEERPRDFSKPDAVKLLEKETNTQIDPANRRVTIQRADAARLDAEFPMIFSGRLLQGRKIAELIAAARDPKVENGENIIRVIELGKPYYLYPVTLRLDANHRVTDISQDNAPSGRSAFDHSELKLEWSVAQPGKVPYVSHLISTVRIQKRTIRTEAWTREVEVNPAFAPDRFTVPVPEGYSTYDLRKLLTPPIFGARISPATPSQKKQN